MSPGCCQCQHALNSKSKQDLSPCSMQNPLGKALSSEMKGKAIMKCVEKSALVIYFHTLFALSAGTEAQHHPSTPCRSLQASPLPCPRRAELSLPSPRTHRALPSLSQGSEQTFCSSLELRAVNSAALPSIWPRACPRGW